MIGELSRTSLELAVLRTLGEDALVESGMEDFRSFVSAYITEPSDAEQRRYRLGCVWSIVADQRGKLYHEAFRERFGSSFDLHGFAGLTEEQTVPLNQSLQSAAGPYTGALDYLRGHNFN